MNYFLNYKNGEITVRTYREPAAMVTDVDDIVVAVNEERDEILTADLTGWIKESGGSVDGEDALERLFETELGLSMYDYPELRDVQRGDA